MVEREMAKKWSVGARSETGYVRNENQDRMSYVKAPFGDIYIVSDGMGVHRGGALAAELTVETLNQSLSRIDFTSSDSNTIECAFEEANEVVYNRGHLGNADTEGMGATAVVLLVAQFQVMVAHVGDSRAYLFTGENKLDRLTKDHSRVQRMIDAGILTPAEASAHPDASILERAIGASPTVKIDISSWLPLREGDQILLCSDGLHGYVSDTEIAAILSNQGTPQELVDQLVKLALEKGGEDNVTVQLIECEGSDEAGVSRIMGRLAIVVPGIMVLSAVTAFVATEYWPPATLKVQLEAVERKNDARDAELLKRADKVDQSLESLRVQIAQLNQKIDRLDKVQHTPQSSQNTRGGQSPKSKKGKVVLPSEKHRFTTSQATGKNAILSNTPDQSAEQAAQSRVTSEVDDERTHQSENSDVAAAASNKSKDEARVNAGDGAYLRYSPISDSVDDRWRRRI